MVASLLNPSSKPNRIHTIEVVNKPLAKTDVVSDLEERLREMGIEGAKITSTALYTVVGDYSSEDLTQFANLTHHDLTQTAIIDEPLEIPEWDFAIRVDSQPGVTDNAARVFARSAHEIGKSPEVYTSVIHYVKGSTCELSNLTNQLQRVASNPQIHDIKIITRSDFLEQGGFEQKIHPVDLGNRPNFFYVNIGTMTDAELIKMGKLGTLNTSLVKPGMQPADIDALRGGTLALDLDFSQAIQNYANSDMNAHQRGKLTDTEIETLAQMWSDHCRHIWYSAKIPDNSHNKGIFSTYIREPTLEVLENRKKAGKPNLGVSVFSDNSGVFYFNDKWCVSIKNETHNSPSALDPYGGAITGIVGVNRDIMGTGVGAELIGNAWFYFVGNQGDTRLYYKNKFATGELSNLLLNPFQILSGVNKGVEHGGNQMGIPTLLGRTQYDERYNGKPIVQVLSWGRLPHEIQGQPTYEKHIDVGDRLYILGGRAGKDGIHGATFSSEELSKNSPATAVQIGDAYTQRKLSEALLELRDLGYVKFVTDLGAGGVSCAALEMASETGGLDANIDLLLQKYPGMTATELFLNESQERMAIAIDPSHKDDIERILKKHDVEFSDIGSFTNSGRAVIYAKGDKVVDLDMDFIHHGYPIKTLQFADYKLSPAVRSNLETDLTASLLNSNMRSYTGSREVFYLMFGSPNMSSIAPLADVMDSSVKGLAVQHCIQGKGRITTQACCSLVDQESAEGLVVAYGHSERQSYIDAKQMGINAFIRSVGHTIAMGGNLDHMVATDQVLWQSPRDPRYQLMLKEANEGMAEVIRAFQIPVISGKDSMTNQATVYDALGNEVQRGVYPTLEIITAAKIDDVSNMVTIDVKNEGDLVYVVGATTKSDLGGSEYTHVLGQQIGKELLVGNVSAEDLSDVYDTFNRMNIAQRSQLLASSIYVGQCGLLGALTASACAGELGIAANLHNVHQAENLSHDELQYSETEGRFLVTVSPSKKEKFEQLFRGKYSHIGTVTGNHLHVKIKINHVINEPIAQINQLYHRVNA